MLEDRYELAFKLYPYVRSGDQDAPRPAHHPVVIAGGGPIGMACALDLGLKGHKVIVLDDHEGVGVGSRAICFAKRTLEIADRLGAGGAMLDKGVVWQKGRVFHDRDEIFDFDLLPEDGHRYPAFINLSQSYFEKFMVEAVERANASGADIELRGKNRIDALTVRDDGVVQLDIQTHEDTYSITADWVIACDGARSPIRDMLGLGFEGRVFEDNFLIADVKMKADFPTERWFWFEPWFKSGSSALLHKQPDDIWRIDFQLGWDIDRQKELKEENIKARVDAMLGDVEYELDWCSIYTFQCRRMEKFRHGPVIFAGDSAHQVSPFGARGANSGVQDADNLAWKLDLILRGLAPDTLLDSYNDERVFAADENILNSTRATDFLTPKSTMSKVFRDAVLNLAQNHPFARPLVNSGRLSVPCTYDHSLLNGDDRLEGGPARTRVGSACPDAPINNGFLLDKLTGGFTLLTINADAPDEIDVDGITVKRLAFADREGLSAALKERYLGGAKSAVYLLRPDQHVCARWGAFDESAVAAALRKACGRH